MDKKGFLLGEETLKIVIAVMAVLFLIFLLTSLYFIYTKGSKIEMARNRLEKLIIEDQIPIVIKQGTTEFFIDGPAGWKLITYPAGSDSPTTCGSGNCICFCSKPAFYKQFFVTQQEECVSYGVCSDLKIENINLIPGEIVIDKTNIMLNYNKDGNELQFIKKQES